MLTQPEADALLNMPKQFVDDSRILLPLGANESRLLLGTVHREEFFFDISRGTIALSKVKYQTRARRSVVLARIDLFGAPHTNPDGLKIECPHIHLYREGFDDKWAYALDPNHFPNPRDIGDVYVDFGKFSSIIKLPPLEAAGW